MNQAAEQFHQRAKAFAKANPGMAHVVRGNEDPEAVLAWFTYFHVRGQTGTIAVFRQLLNGNGLVQFPCKRPELFDLTYEPPAHTWREPEAGRQSRGDVSRVVQSTIASLRAAQPKGRPPVPREHLRERVETPGEWLTDYAANPPPVPVFSDEFKSKLERDRKGHTRPEAAE